MNNLKIIHKKQCLVLLSFLTLFFQVSFCLVSAENDVERVIIITVDSMNDILLFNDHNNPDFILTPNLGAIIQNGCVFPNAEAAMPTKTQVNHITIVSGAYADSIGIVGNYVYDPNKKGILFFQKYEHPWKNPELIKSDTIFDSMERKNPEYTTAIVAGKNYVGVPIQADIQVAPAYTSKSAKQLGIQKFPEIILWDSPDEWVMDNALHILEEVDPDLLLINLAFLDPTQHSFGHGSMESWAALSWADYQIGRLVQYLTETNNLAKTLLVVTADHGQSNTWKTIPLGKILRKNSIAANVVADGSFASIFLNDKTDVKRAMKIIEELGVTDGIWSEETFDEVRIRTPYTGDIAVSLRPPYEAFSRVRPPFIGIHGGLQQRFVPIIFYGAHVKRGVELEGGSLTDIVPTICEITGLPLPDDSNGVILPVYDSSITQAPAIKTKFVEFTNYNTSYLPIIFATLSVLTLIPALLVRKGSRLVMLELSSENLSNLIPFILMTTSVIFAIGSSFYSYIVNLYAIPGVQPDAFLVAMDFGILGSFLVSISVSLVILWYVPVLMIIILQRLSGRKWRIRAMPYSLLFICVSQLVFTGINMVSKIPFNYAFHVFIIFFFGSLGLSYFHRIQVIRQHVKYRRKLSVNLTIISGMLVSIIWLYLTMSLLFPNYLFELGIPTIV